MVLAFVVFAVPEAIYRPWSRATGAGAGAADPRSTWGDAGELGRSCGAGRRARELGSRSPIHQGGDAGELRRGDITPQVTSGTRPHVETPPEFLLSRYAIPISHIHFRPIKGTAPRVRARGGSRRPEIWLVYTFFFMNFIHAEAPHSPLRACANILNAK